MKSMQSNAGTTTLEHALSHAQVFLILHFPYHSIPTYSILILFHTWLSLLACFVQSEWKITVFPLTYINFILLLQTKRELQEILQA